MVGHLFNNQKTNMNNSNIRNNNNNRGDPLTSTSSSSSSLQQPRSTPAQNLTPEAVAALPPPGLTGPTSIVFSPHSPTAPTYLAFLSSSPQHNINTPNNNNHHNHSNHRRYQYQPHRQQQQQQQHLSMISADRQLCVIDTSRGFSSVSPLLRYPSSTDLSSGNHLHNNSHHHYSNGAGDDSLEEKLRRERQRLHSSGSGVTQFNWVLSSSMKKLILLIPLKGSLYVQHGIDGVMTMIYDKSSSVLCRRGRSSSNNSTKTTGSVVGRDAAAIDAQLSPDGTMVAFVVAGDIYLVSTEPAVTAAAATSANTSQRSSLPQMASSLPSPFRSNLRNSHKQTPPPATQRPIRLTYGALQEGSSCITHGLADFVAQEEMDRYRGFWWHPDGSGLLFTEVDESNVPPYRIHHQGSANASAEDSYEDHRYPFAGQANPTVKLGFIRVDNPSKTSQTSAGEESEFSAGSSTLSENSSSSSMMMDAHEVAKERWNNSVIWFNPPREAKEYLARVSWFPDGTACAQWQNRTQTTLVLAKLDPRTGHSRTMLVERTDVWINLHSSSSSVSSASASSSSFCCDALHVLPRPIHPDECTDSVERIVPPGRLPPGSFSFLFASERTGYHHLYLYTFVPGINSDRAILIRPISAGDWMVESIVGVDMDSDAVYVTGTFDSCLERHLYVLPLLAAASSPSSSSTPPATISSRSDDQQNGGSDSQQSGGGMRRQLKNVMSALSGTKSSVRPRDSMDYNNRSSSSLLNTTATPIRLTTEQGMHNIVMDDKCGYFVDTSSDLGRPTTVKVYQLPEGGPFSLTNQSSSGTSRGRKVSRKLTNDYGEIRLLHTLYDASSDDKTMHSFYTTKSGNNNNNNNNNNMNGMTGIYDVHHSSGITSITERLLPAPELLSFPTTDGTETLHAALYRPDPRVHGPGPYPLICSVYGGPHVQRVNRSWSQCCDMRAQRLRSLGFCVVKCDNRGSSRRGLAFEGAIRRRLGRLEVLDQVAAVRHLVLCGIADSRRVGVYGWSYGGYLAAMCLCRAPDVFHVAVAGAPVTSWDGYDTHYTERYMGLPSDNVSGYRESAVLDHVPNLRGKLMIVHGLIDENVHFRHTARLINRLIANGKDYDLLIFPDERHSPRRLRDRIYMEQRISDFFSQTLLHANNIMMNNNNSRTSGIGMNRRPTAGL